MAVLSAILVLVIFVLSALLAASETAITGSSYGKIYKFKKRYPKQVARLEQILKIRDQVISVILIGNNLLIILCTTIATQLFITIFGNGAGVIISSIVMSTAIIVFSEVLPKTIAVVKSERVALLASGVILILVRILQPVSELVDSAVKICCKIFGISLAQEVSRKEEMRGMIEHYHKEGAFIKDNKDMLKGVIDMEDIKISEIMIQLRSAFTIDIDLPVAEICRQAYACKYTRIPVFKGDKDNIIGILNVKNLSLELERNNFKKSEIDISSILQDVWFCFSQTSALQQLSAFRAREKHIACVVDEYGDLQGIVTLNDILEEIIGQIYDAGHDRIINNIKKIAKNKFIVDGSTTIRDMNRQLGWQLQEQESKKHYNTIAGLVIHHAMRIPNENEIFIIDNLQITILKRECNVIKSLKLEKKEKKITL